jgi:hypothetical protein
MRHVQPEFHAAFDEFHVGDDELRAPAITALVWLIGVGGEVFLASRPLAV